MSSDLALKQRIIENAILFNIITRLKLKLGIINGQVGCSSAQMQEMFDEIIFLSKLKLFHVFVINKKLTALIVDKDNHIYELKSANLLKSVSKMKTGKNENFDELNKIIDNETGEIEEIKDLCCGKSHALVLTKSGKIYAWGKNNRRQLGIYSSKESKDPVYVNIPIEVKKVCCGYYHNLALSETGFLYAWGCNEDKQCCCKNEMKIIEPKQINGKLPQLIDISCGAYHSLALDKNGNVYSWGKNDYGQLGIGHNGTSKGFHKVQITPSVVKIVSGFSHNLLLTNAGQVYAFGSNQFKQISEINKKYYCKPTIVLFENNETRFQDIAASLSIPVSLASVKNISGIDTQCFAWGSCVSETENKHSMQEWFVKYKNSTYRPVNFQPKEVTLKNNPFSDERIEACLWSTANNILEIFEFEKPLKSVKKSELSKDKKEKKVEDLFRKLMQINNRKPPDPDNIRVFAKLNIYHTLTGNMWKKYGFKPERFSKDFDNKSKIGRGGFGTVYRARFIGMNDEENNSDIDINVGIKYHEEVAIKRIAINEYDVTKALREMELIRNLNTDFIVLVYSFWLDYNELFNDEGDFTAKIKQDKDNKLHHTLIRLNIESELCVTSLDEVLFLIETNDETSDRQKIDIFLLPLGYYIASELVLEILSAVDYLHRHRLTHRDLSPQNILIKDFKDYDGVQRFVKIADFGLAVFQYKDNQTYSTENIMGKVNYIPHEILMKGVKSMESSDWTIMRKIDDKKELKDIINQSWDLFSIGYIFKQMFFIHTIHSEAVYEKKSASIHEKLQNKYHNLFKETNLLRSETAKERPKCNELLKEDRRRNYLLNKQECLELCKEEDLFNYKKKYDKELELDNFIDFFLHKKLN